MIARYVAVLGLLGCAMLPFDADAQRHRHPESITCESRDYRPGHCRVDWRHAQLVRQLSKTACIEGRTWGMDRSGIWVNDGCAGVFAPARRGHHGAGGWRPGPGWDRSIRLTCKSEDYRYRMCRVDTGRGSAVRIERRISDTRCIEGRNWGWNRAGIWVDHGCAAVFVVDRRWR